MAAPHDALSQQAKAESLLPEETPSELAQRCGTAVAGSLAALCISIGHRLGLFQALKRLGRAAPSDLAAAVDCSERFIREWCYQQAAARFISCDKDAATFWLSAAQEAVLCVPQPGEEPRETPLDLVLLMPNVLSNCDLIAGTFQSGRGLTFDQLKMQHCCPSNRHARAVQWVERFKLLPGLHEQLVKGIKVADVGCGCGEVLLHLAQTFPNSSFVGYDISDIGLTPARRQASEQGSTNLTFLNPNDGPGSRLPSEPTFHLMLVQEALHDMTQPAQMLKAIRRAMLSSSSSTSGAAPAPPVEQPTSSSIAAGAAAGSGTSNQQADALADYDGGPLLLVSDIRSTGSAAANISCLPQASVLYGMSVAVCLSSALSEEGGAGLGTVGFHEAVAREMSAAAGFTRFSMLSFPCADTGREFSSHLMFRP